MNIVKYKQEEEIIYTSGDVIYKVRQLTPDRFQPIISKQGKELIKSYSKRGLSSTKLCRANNFLITLTEKLALFEDCIIERRYDNMQRSLLNIETKENKFISLIEISSLDFTIPGFKYMSLKAVDRAYIKYLKAVDTSLIKPAKLTSQDKKIIIEIKQKASERKQTKFLSQAVKKPHDIDTLLNTTESITGSSNIESLLKP